MRITNAHLAHQVVPVNSVWMVWLANLALPAYLACPVIIHRFPCRPMDVVVGAHPVPLAHLVHQAQLAREETKVNLEIQAHRLEMEVLEVLVHQAALANQANKAVPVRQAMPADLPKLDKKATMDHPAVQANLVQVATTPNVEAPVTLAVPAPTDLLAIRAPAENQATKAPQDPKVHLEVPARMPNIVPAPEEPRPRKRKSRKPKKETIWNSILLFAIQFNFYVRKQANFFEM